MRDYEFRDVMNVAQGLTNMVLWFIFGCLVLWLIYAGVRCICQCVGKSGESSCDYARELRLAESEKTKAALLYKETAGINLVRERESRGVKET